MKAQESYSKLLELNPLHTLANEKFTEIEKKMGVLRERGNTIYPYHQVNALSGLHFLTSLGQTVNKTINLSPTGRITLGYRLAFDTLGQNKSTLLQEIKMPAKKKSPYTILGVSESFSALLQAPLLTPATREGFYVNALSEYNLDLTWGTKKVKFVRKVKYPKLKPQNGFGSMTPVMQNFLQKDSLLNCAGKYTFQVREVKANNLASYQIELKNFSTVGAEAMAYSLLYPGVGSLVATRGEKGTGFVVTFTIFGGLAAGSYFLHEKTKNDPGSLFNNDKNILKWTMIGLASVSGAIYVSSAFTALAQGIKNWKRSTHLRKLLKDNTIEYIQEDCSVPDF